MAKYTLSKLIDIRDDLSLIIDTYGEGGGDAPLQL